MHEEVVLVVAGEIQKVGKVLITVAVSNANAQLFSDVPRHFRLVSFPVLVE